GDVWTVLFGATAIFFKTQALSMDERPDRTIIHRHAACGKRLLQGAQRQRRLLGKAPPHDVAMRRHKHRPAPARLVRGDTPGCAIAPRPFRHRRGADAKALANRADGSARNEAPHDTNPKI